MYQYKSNILDNYELDDIAKYIYYSEIIHDGAIEPTLKEKVLSSDLVKKITNQQFEDGSWDRFHTLSSDSTTDITTENALRRLLLLGLDIQDEPIKKAFTYMEQFLEKKLDIRDRKEGFSDWNEITELFAATWMLEIDRHSKIAGAIADKWALLVTRSFVGESFDYEAYAKAFVEIFNTKPGKRVWDIESFHIVSIVQGRLEPEVEEKFVDYIMKNEKGIYYIAKGKLLELPLDFMSRETSRFIYAHTLLSRYACYKDKCSYVVEWLMENRDEDGFWDLGSKVKDGVFFPLSDSWRKRLNRKIDSTVFIQRYVTSTTKLRLL